MMDWGKLVWAGWDPPFKIPKLAFFGDGFFSRTSVDIRPVLGPLQSILYYQMSRVRLTAVVRS